MPARAGQRYLVAPDSFKGSLSATAVAQVMGSAILEAAPRSEVILRPVSDGGEGLVDILRDALHAVELRQEVSGPLPGQKVSAAWLLSRDGSTAFIEMASAAGLLLIPAERRDPKGTTTAGVGELMRAALDRGACTLIVGIGGSGTNDGGAGMAEALGARLLDARGRPIPVGGAALRHLASIDVQGMDPRLQSVSVIAACDVRNPLVGPEGASQTYSPQKGASPGDVLVLEDALQRYREVLRATFGVDVQQIPGSGAAGGLGAGLAAFCRARLTPGIDVVLDAVGFDEELRRTDLVITGEGKIDRQTKFGKALSGVLSRAQRAHKPVAAVVGEIDGTREEFVGLEGFLDLLSLVNESTPRAEAMRNARRLLHERTVTLVSRLQGTDDAPHE